MASIDSTKLLKHIPAPLLEDLSNGRWLPFVGAGFSKNATVADGALPLAWGELGSALSADVHGLDPATSALEAISAYEHAFSRAALVDRTSRLIRAHDAAPGDAHIAFAKVGFLNVVTTNFDFLLERAYDRVGKGCLPILDEVQLSSHNQYAGPRLVKMHGDVHHPDRLIITEDDYDRFLLDYPLIATSVSAMLVDHTTVLIGYSLDDPDTRQLLALIKNRLGRLRRPLWTVQIGVAAHVVQRFERRGVKVINLPRLRGHDYGATLTILFDELAAYWESRISATAESTDDRITADLRVPNEPSRICFFAVPLHLSGWYRETVFPLVESYGYVPTFARDIASEAGTIQTTLDTLISRAALRVVEVGPESQKYEASLAMRRGRDSSLLLVAEESESRRPVTALLDHRFLSRPSKLESDPTRFLAGLRMWLEENSKGRSPVREPERLLASREYRAALVSAVSLLEVTLARALGSRDQLEQRSMSLRLMVRNAFALGIMGSTEISVIEDAITSRNEALHLHREVSPTLAKKYVVAIRNSVVELERSRPDYFD